MSDEDDKYHDNISINEEEPDACEKMASINSTRKASPVKYIEQVRSANKESVKSEKMVDIIEDAKSTINDKIAWKRSLELSNSELSLQDQSVKEEILNIRKKEKQLNDKIKLLAKLYTTTHKKCEEDKIKLRQYISISQEMITANKSSISTLKEEYDQLALSINIQLNKLTELRTKLPHKIIEIKNECTEYDNQNLIKYKEIEELKRVLLKCKEVEKTKIKLFRSKSRALHKCIEKDGIAVPKMYRKGANSCLKNRISVLK